jgi:hypothetical protein
MTPTPWLSAEKRGAGSQDKRESQRCTSKSKRSMGSSETQREGST